MSVSGTTTGRIFESGSPPYHWIVEISNLLNLLNCKRVAAIYLYELGTSIIDSRYLNYKLYPCQFIARLVISGYVSHNRPNARWQFTGFRTFEKYLVCEICWKLALAGRVISDRSRRCFSGWSDHLTFYFHRNISRWFVGIFRRSRCVAGHDSPLLWVFIESKLAFWFWASQWGGFGYCVRICRRPAAVKIFYLSVTSFQLSFALSAKKRWVILVERE